MQKVAPLQTLAETACKPFQKDSQCAHKPFHESISFFESKIVIAS
jgi:hypothetical protein